MTALAVVFIVLGVLVFLSPLVYVVLNLMGKIGPEHYQDAVLLGVCIYIVFWFVAAIFFGQAVNLLS